MNLRVLATVYLLTREGGQETILIDRKMAVAGIQVTARSRRTFHREKTRPLNGHGQLTAVLDPTLGEIPEGAGFHTGADLALPGIAHVRDEIAELGGNGFV